MLETAAECFHLLSSTILLWRMWRSKSCHGVSLRTQLLLLLSLLSKHSVIFWVTVSNFDTVLRVSLCAITAVTAFAIVWTYKASYQSNYDTFRVEILLLPVGVLTFLVNHDSSTLELMWTFSVYLEAVAILPQLFMLKNSGSAKVITPGYIFALAAYNFFCIWNWIHRWREEDFLDSIDTIAGSLRTALLADFAVLYYTR